MYVSRLCFTTRPGKGHAAGEALKTLSKLVQGHGGNHSRILRTHFGSLGEADFQFEQEFNSLAEFEDQLKAVTADGEFRRWSEEFSSFLERSPKREVLEVLE